MEDTLYRFPAKVTRVVDGDTLVAQFYLLPVAHYQYPKLLMEHKIRLLGVDTPELRSKDPQEKALAYKAKDFTSLALLNEDIIVQATGEDSFGRLLAKVFHSGLEFNAVLLENQIAKPYVR
jgi:endonuclease YncB( thermonuclease family)